MSVSSYGHGSQTSGQVRLNKDLDTSIEGLNVIVVEDILDTGLTLGYLLRVLQQRKPNSLKIAALLDKPERRIKKDVKADYIGFQIPNEFVVGLRAGLCGALSQSQGCLRSFASAVVALRSGIRLWAFRMPPFKHGPVIAKLSYEPPFPNETTHHSRGSGTRPAKREVAVTPRHDHHSSGARRGRTARDHVSYQPLPEHVHRSRRGIAAERS